MDIMIVGEAVSSVIAPQPVTYLLITETMYALTIFCVMCIVINITYGKSLPTKLHSYVQQRNEILEDESKHHIGGNLQLTGAEIDVNNILMKLKHKELDEAFKSPGNSMLSQHYFSYKDRIENSKTYEIIRKMPKGAALHIHSSYMLDPDTLLSFTYEDHLYICYPNKSKLTFQFSESTPNKPCDVKWELLSELRSQADDIESFDQDIRRHLTLYSTDNLEQNADINTIWRNFEQVHGTLKGLISYRPIREKHFYKSLEFFYNDNILYIEMRGSLTGFYELNGTVHDQMYSAELYRSIANKFAEDHPDFIGFKLILTAKRSASEDKIRWTLEIAKKLKAEYPDIFAGFDLVGQEDVGRPLAELQPLLAEYKDEIDYYFHAGETNWFGTATDENLVDAVLLGTKRLGHAYALIKHPSVLKVVKQRSIAVEVNVISNAVLALVRDLRNHPLATYIALGVPVVLSSDDPGAWESDPLSYDFYVAFVSVASRTSDLRLLKELALNSIRYSALDDEGKRRFFKVFFKRWNQFLDEVLIRHNRYPTIRLPEGIKVTTTEEPLRY